MKKRVDIFTLSIYGLVIFPKALGHVDDAKVEKVSYQVFSDNYSPLKEFVTTPRQDNILKEKWMVILLGIWGAIRYAPLLVLRWYRLRQFIPATQGLAQYEFVYKGDNYKKKRSLELGKKIEQLEEKKIQSKIDYKKLRLSMRTARLGKTLEQSWQELPRASQI
ncbi:hypothetical protein Golob_024597 [Gossypium lobatum]|uniref:Uncharacterized protein n=1 Tax=Gossypium lobatum TaxID=34289 RepID=A0A7J8NDA2_9ROSI|nr:hypothetical protein [Gossypium lobatum]